MSWSHERVRAEWVDYAVGEIGLCMQSALEAEANTLPDLRIRAAIESAIEAGFRALLQLEHPDTDSFIRVRLRDR